MVVAFGIIESELPKFNIHGVVYIFQFISMSNNYVWIFTTNNGYLPLTILVVFNDLKQDMVLFYI